MSTERNNIVNTQTDLTFRRCKNLRTTLTFGDVAYFLDWIRLRVLDYASGNKLFQMCMQTAKFAKTFENE